MIRLFDVFDKGNFTAMKAVCFISMCMRVFKINQHPCPKCGATHPAWKYHGKYMRNLINFEFGKVVTYRITVYRYKCSSCLGTHAILPALIIPYGQYSLLFIMAVMRDYFYRNLTVEQICRKYSIAPSTLYEWKALYHKHKKLWLGLLDDLATSATQFLESFFHGDRLRQLNVFFRIAGVSFLQRSQKTAPSAPG